MNKKVNIPIAAVIMGTLFLLMIRPELSAAREKVNVVVNKGISLRSLAEKHLGNPDEWQTILLYNGLRHPTDLKPDMTLAIPSGLFKRTVKHLKQAAETARFANMEGAGVLATESIGESIRLGKAAMDFKKKGKLEDADKAALQAVQWAEKALSEGFSISSPFPQLFLCY